MTTIYRNHPETDEEMKLDVEYDIEPYEPMTRDSPGSDGGVIVTKITCNGVDVMDLFDTSDIEHEIENELADECDPPDEPDFDPDAADRMADDYFSRFNP